MEKVTLEIEGMTCNGCVKSVNKVLESLSGVSSVHVTLQPGEAQIEFDPNLTDINTLKQAIEGAGFDVSG